MRKLAESSPSPNSLPAAVSPSFDSVSLPAPSSVLPNESSSTTPDGDTTDPDQLIDSPMPSIFPPPLAPLLQSSPPPQPATPDGPPPASTPPFVQESPPPSQTPPPPSIPSSPPPRSPPLLSPPPTDTTLSPPPVDANLPPPAVSTPPSPSAVPPPQSSLSPPEVVSSPPPPRNEKPASPPPAEKPASPPPADKSASPPPVEQSGSPPPSEKPSSPPPADKPASSPPPEKPVSPPPADNATSLPPAEGPPLKFSPSPPNSESAPSPTATITPSPPGPSRSFQTSPPPTTSNTSGVGVPPTSQMPLVPTEKPTAKPTNDSGVPLNSKSEATGGLSSGGAVAISIAVVFVVLCFIAMAVLFVRRRKNKGSKVALAYPAASLFGSPHNSDSYLLKSPASQTGTKFSSNFIHSSSEQGGMNSSRSWFTYEELEQATGWFSAHNELGEGGFGKVYKGVLADGRDVAVKQLKIGSGQGEREFKAEVEIISRIHHRHLVSLVGYCISEQQRLLVYDYVPNNTLHYHLCGIGRPVMEWSIRVKAAAGAARGLAYLHEDCNPRIIHRDIKSTNILLDNNYEAKVADFGLAKLAMELDSQTHISTRVMGTFGYMAPEYATSGKLTEKSDVYSFGVVLLELITGRKPVDDSQPPGDESLVEWARPRLAQALESELFDTVVDPRLERNYNANEMFRMIEAAAACVRHQAVRRPKMSQVVRVLDTIGEEPGLSNGMKLGQTEVYDSAEHSAQIRMLQKMAFGNGSSIEYSSSYINDSQSSLRY